MSQPPPFVLPPDGPRSRVRAVLAGAGRQRVAVAVLEAMLAPYRGGGLLTVLQPFVPAAATTRVLGRTSMLAVSRIWRMR